MTCRARLVRETPERVERLRALGGDVVYRVELDRRWVGWVGDERAWRGSRYGARRWWSCWRQDGDTAARWNNGDTSLPTRAAALTALLDQVSAATPRETGSTR